MRRYLSGLFSPHRAAALVWAVCLLTGCTAEETDEWTSDGRTTSVTLRVPMAETLTTRTTDAEYATDEEKIKTLRILVFSQDKPVINEAFNEAELSDGSVTITGVPVGTVTFYAVANEEALGKDYSDMSNFENNLVEVNGVKKAWVKDEEDPKHFPLRFTDPQVKKYGLPMSWVQRDMTIEPPGAEPQEIEVELRRCVAKLNVIMSNTLSDPITITEMRFGEFSAISSTCSGRPSSTYPKERIMVSKPIPRRTSKSRGTAARRWPATSIPPTHGRTRPKFRPTPSGSPQLRGKTTPISFSSTSTTAG